MYCQRQAIGTRLNTRHEPTSQEKKDTEQMKKIVLLSMLTLLFSISCKKNNNPLIQIQSNVCHQKLLISKDSSVYHWQQSQWDENFFHIYIQGTLINKSDTLFYSYIGDGFELPEQSRLHFAHNSGYLEKYDPNEHIWIVHDITNPLWEGSRMVPIKPLLEYTFSSNLI